jgi:hypothetical protein
MTTKRKGKSKKSNENQRTRGAVVEEPDVILLLELVDAVRARHVTPDISVYYTVVAEPYFVGFRSV